jgi:hypothetical protein
MEGIIVLLLTFIIVVSFSVSLIVGLIFSPVHVFAVLVVIGGILEIINIYGRDRCL